MFHLYTKEENDLIEEAIVFLVTEYSQSGHNPKPVILHSLRVGMKLAELGETTKVVASALLHDLLEDSAVTTKQLTEKFGAEIANTVKAVSFKPDLTDKREQYREMLARTVAGGLYCMKIKCVDILDNSDYYTFGHNQASESLLLDKVSDFLTLTADHLKNFLPHQELKEKYQTLLKEFSEFYG